MLAKLEFTTEFLSVYSARITNAQGVFSYFLGIRYHSLLL